MTQSASQPSTAVAAPPSTAVAAPPSTADGVPQPVAVLRLERPPVKADPAVALISIDGALTRPAPSAFEMSAEAPEKSIPLAIEAASELDELDDGLAIGEAPPPTYPRARCDDIFVYIVTIAEGEPRHSAASLGVGKAGPARFRRPGEKIGDWTVLAITDDWTGLNPDVWLERDGVACRAELAGNPSRVHSALERPRAQRATVRRKKRR